MADYAIHDTTLYDIADVIRKKDGSSALIDPADYAERINLMGMLEEKTVSGSVVTFADGADAVKLKSCAVTIAPTLDGVSSVGVVSAGKNIVDFSEHINASSGGFTFSKVANGGISFSTTSSGTWAYVTSEFDFYVPKNTTITFSRDTAFSFRHYVRLTYKDGTTQNVYINADATSATVTTSEEVTAIRLYMSQLTQGESYSGTVYLMIEVGSTATAYEPYVTPTIHTASLGRTIYGGSVDVVNGMGTDEWSEPFTFTGAESENWNWGQNGGFYRANITVSGIAYTVGARSECFCNLGTYKASGNDYNACFIYGNPTSAQFFFYPPQGIESLADFKTWLSSNNLKMTAPKATPEDFTFTPVPINSRLGDNTMWSDDGDLSVVYRSSGTQTLIPPTLISKTITENGTYSAENDGADGYDEVTVNVSGGGGNTPQATQTLICDNSALGSTLTFTDDYENYDLIKFVVYLSDVQNTFVFYATPNMINACWQYSSNRINFNQPYGNNYVCYTKTSNTSWSRYGVRNMAVQYVYGLTFTNCTVAETELYNRQAIGSSATTFTPRTGESFLDYDYILFMTCTGNSDETQVNLEVFQPNIEKDIFGSDNVKENAVTVYRYNTDGTTATVTENTITSYQYFYASGLKLNFNQQNLLGGSFNSSNSEELNEELNELNNEQEEVENESD